jgi:ABC-type dipeptide/oligopeptide/nickel transport system permease subunit
MSKNKEIERSPSYYVRQRMLRNKPAMVGLVVILIAHFVAILGYLIMPDNSPNASDGAVQIQKQLPGFEVNFIKKLKNVEIEERGFFHRMFYGQESSYILTPVTEISMEDWHVTYRTFSMSKTTKGNTEKVFILTSVRKVYDEGDKYLDEEKNIYKIEWDGVTYLDEKGNKQSATLKELQTEFFDKNIEHRKYYLGTDRSGRDILSKLIFGTRIALAIGFVSVLISLFLGVSLGAIAGFLGGKVDSFISWLMTVVWSVPAIMLIIAISIALQSKGIWVAFVAVGLTMWVEVARVVRGQLLEIKEKNFIEAARALGLNNARIIIRHILPNLFGPIIVIANANYASAILLEAGLSFLGLGVQPPMPSWGNMVNEGFHSIGVDGGIYLVLFPSLCIMVMILSFNMFGNGLRDAYDPKS